MNKHIPQLDGWRATSITLVLAGHLIPLGPNTWQLNATTAATGMALFFNLSGFLITTNLLKNPKPTHFLTRRIARIIPLAYTTIIITAATFGMTKQNLTSHLLFTSNLNNNLAPQLAHFWSLSVEIHFYILIALLYATAGTKALKTLPYLLLTLTLYKTTQQPDTYITTQYRIDEILAGCTLALYYHHRKQQPTQTLTKIHTTIIPITGALLLAASHPNLPQIGHAKPYLAATLIGLTIIHPNTPTTKKMIQILSNKKLAYIATISYALYVTHGGLMHPWGQIQNTQLKYSLLPVLLAATWAISHASTFHFEARCVKWAKNKLK